MLAGLTLTAPFMLAALATLPVLWWLLRLTPPAPKRVDFPAVRILNRLPRREETPSRSPWWLTVLRLLLAAAIIIALAGPRLQQSPPLSLPDGPMALIIDNGWSSAPHWTAQMTTAQTLLGEAGDADRLVLLVPTAGLPSARLPVPAEEAAETLETLTPRPYPGRYSQAADAVEAAAAQAGGAFNVVLLSDGIANDPDSLTRLLALDANGEARIFGPQGQNQALALRPPVNGATDLRVGVVRPGASASIGAGEVRALDSRGRAIAETEFSFGTGETEAEAVFALPVELRNSIRRLEITGSRSAASVQLLDRSAQRRTVALVSGEAGDADQPLLSTDHYVINALSPFATVFAPRNRNLTTGIAAAFERNASVIAMTDVGTLPDAEAEALERWVDDGGMLIRFAGDRLAASDDARLLPVILRRGGRTLGGTLSWSTPRPVAEFPAESPFAGIELSDTVTVARQVLAAPSIDLIDSTWAQLDDGTPLVTATQQGKGWLVLFHVAPDGRWSNLAISGVFVEMLQRLVALAPSSLAAADAPDEADAAETPDGLSDTGSALLAPARGLDAYGDLGDPAPTARPIALSDLGNVSPSPETPPGYYGPDTAPLAVNLMSDETPYTVTNWSDMGTDPRAYISDRPVDLRPPLFIMAMLLLLADSLAMLWLTGRLGRSLRPSTSTISGLALAGPIFVGLLMGGMAITASPLSAQSLFDSQIQVETRPGEPSDNAVADTFAMNAANVTRLAYVRTGNAEIDAVTRDGLRGLTFVLGARTALEPGDPVGVDVDRDELAFFPLLYWSVDAGAETPAPETLARIDAYMKQGGTIIFDTREALTGGFQNTGQPPGPGTLALRRLLAGLDIPALEPVPDDHVLTKTFYLLNSFVGRYAEGALWVEAGTGGTGDPNRPARGGDGVSSVIITSNDLVGAWAVDDLGRARLPLAGGGQAQREFAYRAGVNLVLYTLTGNYKADQVHIPALLERLGQ